MENMNALAKLNDLYYIQIIILRRLYFIQWHIGGIVSDVANMIFALPIMPLYNNQKGKNFKYFFYIYYVAHVVILWILSNIL